jgi:PAS domain S-box-containing protein
MATSPHRDPSTLFRTYAVYSRIAALIAIAVGVLVVLGWTFDVGALKSIVPSASTMKPNTALAFILAGIALLLQLPERGRQSGNRRSMMAANACAVVVGLIGLLTTIEHLAHVDLGIDRILFPASITSTVITISHPGRMTFPTAIALALVGGALLLIDFESRRGHRPTEYIALVVGFVGLVPLVGYAYDVQELYHLSAYSSMALHVALPLMVLAAGLLLARPDRGLMMTVTSDRSGGLMARRLLPVAILLPLVIGWLRLEGERASIYGPTFGLALHVTTTIVIFSLVVWASARSLNRIDNERSRAEGALSASERRFRALIENSVEGIVLVDAQANVVYVSPSVESIEGYTSEELLGRNAAADTHPDDWPALHEQFGNVLATPGVPFLAQWRRRRKDGQWIWLEGFATNLLDDPAVQAVVSNYRDITDRKAAEEELRESEERFSHVFQSSPAGMALLRLKDLRYVDVNASWLAMIGYAREEVVGHTAAELGVSDPFDRNDRIERIKAAGRVYDEDVVLTTKQGERRTFLVSVQMLTMRSEPYIIGVYVDITERRRAEAAKARLEEQLLQSQKMEALGTLASGIAHDFNNILTAIVGNMKLARADLPADHPIQQNLGDAYNAGIRASELVRRILTFGRRQEPDRIVLKPAPVVEEAVELLRATLPAKIEIRTSALPGLPDVAADATQIHQVIMNLGTNAAHALNENGGLIDIRLERANVDAALATTVADLREGPYVRLSVSDNGCGMDHAVVRRIFEPFFTTKGPGEGTGLGLSVVHGIMQSHDGAMTVYSEPGRGTTFNLFFPASADAAGAESPKLAEDIQGHGRRLLYVDDESALVTLFTMILNGVGYVVTGISDPKEALELFRSSPRDFDVVITDLSMPGMSGLDLARKLLEIRPGIPIMLMSGYMPESDIEVARGIGVRGFVTKPATGDSLEQALHRLLHESAAGTMN